MHFGLHFLGSCSDTQTPQQRYRETIEQAVFGESLGFESVWPVEHHFDREVSSISSPLLLLAAIAQHTHTLRLGTGVVQVPLSQPLRVAEEIATLDVLSNGRVELGVGRGSNNAHFAGYDVNLTENRARFEEGLALIERALGRKRFSFAGRFYNADNALLAPEPVQSRVPVRVAANTPETARWAGLHGYPIIVACHVHPLSKLPALLDVYRSARMEGGFDRGSQDDVSLVMPLFVGETTQEVEQTLEQNIKHWCQLSAKVCESALGSNPSDEQRAFIRGLAERLRSLTFAQLSDGMACLGSAEECRSMLREVQKLEVGRVIAWFNFGGLLPHRTVLRSMERFSTTVMPAFQAGK